ncbi:hypothetical protein ABEB36_006252 [Hypothenemus hampei]|uniref:Uncharacterized protein n=1 Tax=Hypothenemus hampei TaxID=57062 RepID=A0ABD1EQA1_HYPHA
MLRDKSGIEYTESEKDNLSRSIHEMINESGKEKRKKTKSVYIENEKKIKEQGVPIRDMWATTLQESNKENCVNVVTLESDRYEQLMFVYSISVCLICGDQCLQFVEPADTIILEEQAQDKSEKGKEDELPLENINIPSSSQPQVAGPIRSRTRRMNVQRHGLSYLEKYDKQ